MSRSRAVVYRGQPGQVDLESIATPTPQTGETLVRVLGCTICGSDLHSFEGRRSTPVPTILGHEIVGVIEAFGPGTPRVDWAGQPLTIGSRVTWAIVANCGVCDFCRRDLPQKCLQAVKYGHEVFRPGQELRGGLAEHCLLASGTAMIALPPALSLEAACPASCATATIAAAMEAAGQMTGRSVLVLGAGMLGLTACAMARGRGASVVVCVERQVERHATARLFGADEVISPEPLETIRERFGLTHGFDCVLELTGSPAAFESSFPHVRLGGTIVLVGSVFPAAPVSVSLEQIVRRLITIRGVHNYGPRHLAAAVDFLTETMNQYPWTSLVSDWYPLDQCPETLSKASSSPAIRIGVRPEPRTGS